MARLRWGGGESHCFALHRQTRHRTDWHFRWSGRKEKQRTAHTIGGGGGGAPKGPPAPVPQAGGQAICQPPADAGRGLVQPLERQAAQRPAGGLRGGPSDGGGPEAGEAAHTGGDWGGGAHWAVFSRLEQHRPPIMALVGTGPESHERRGKLPQPPIGQVGPTFQTCGVDMGVVPTTRNVLDEGG